MKLSRIKTLYQLVSKNQRLAMQRHPLVLQNKAMKWFSYVFLSFWAAYFMLFGVLFGRVDDMNYEVFDWVDGGMAFFLAADFLLRFGMQETPAQEIKPYKLLPVPQGFLLNLFLVRMGLRPYNLFLFFFLAPFAFFSLFRFFGVAGMAGFLLGWWLMMVLNSYWYLLWRSLMMRGIWLVTIPIALYAGLIYFGIFFDSEQTWLFDACLRLGRGFCQWAAWAWLVPLLPTVLLFVASRRLQREAVYREVAEEERVRRVRSLQWGWLSHFGLLGQYLLLDVRSVVRNKVVRTQFLSGVVCMLVFCLFLAFTEIYDSPFMRTFIIVYCYSCLGVMTLTNIMGAEGNYIDLLMSRKESVLSLLREKYFFNCAVVLVPFLVSLFPVAQGKILLVESAGCALFAMGCVFPFIFQLAVYNKSTVHLNNRTTRSGRSSRMQMLFSSVALFLPIIIMQTLISLFSRETAAITMLAMGLAGVLLSPLWLRNIYHRFMRRRYENMDGMRTSRDTF